MGEEKIAAEMKNFWETGCLTSEQISSRCNLCIRLQKLLSPFYDNPQIYIYGSTGNGFGMKDADLDILFLPFPEFCSSDFVDDSNQEVPRLWDIRSKKVDKNILLKLGQKGHLWFLRSILSYMKDKYEKPFFVNAKCPIVTFTDLNTNEKCDVSCQNKLVVYNTDLLNFYSNLDPRVKPLVATLRFWAKSLSICPHPGFNSYAFTLLVIFFLQNTDPPILPPVQLLRDLTSMDSVIDGWDASFTRDMKLVHKTTNTENEGILLRNFFEFYWNFDFMQNVICLRSGNCLPIQELKTSADDRLQDFQITAACIQDPFILSHNVSRNVHPKTLNAFQVALGIAYQKVNFKKKEYTNSAFRLLFDPMEYFDTSPKTSYEIFSFEIIPTYEILSSFISREHFEESWYPSVMQALFDILCYALLFECEVIDKCASNFSLTNKLEINEVTISKMTKENEVLLTSIQCCVYNRTWYDRKKAEDNLDSIDEVMEFDDPFLNSEYRISKHVAGTNLICCSPDPILWFDCNCYRSKYSNLRNIRVVLAPLTQTKQFKSLAVFLTSYLNKSVQKIILAQRTVISM